MNNLKDILAKHPFWNGITPTDFKHLGECASLAEYRPGEKIFIQGETAECFHLITEGEVTLETELVASEGIISVVKVGKLEYEFCRPSHGETILSVMSVHAGEPLGWSWLYPPYEWQSTARAVESTEAIVFDAEKLRAMGVENPHFGYEMVLRVGGILAQRLRTQRWWAVRPVVMPTDRGRHFDPAALHAEPMLEVA